MYSVIFPAVFQVFGRGHVKHTATINLDIPRTLTVGNGLNSFVNFEKVAFYFFPPTLHYCKCSFSLEIIKIQYITEKEICMKKEEC